MMHPNDNLQTQEAIFKYDLHTYLRGLGKVDEYLLDAPDIEGEWYDIANTYIPDVAREFNQYPIVVFGWMMYVGMAMVKYWDEDQGLYNKMENLYTYLCDRINFDHIDDYIREKALLLNLERAQQSQNTVGGCAARTNNLLHHLPVIPGSKDAYRAVIAALHQLYLMGVTIQPKSMGYHMIKIG